MGSGSGGHDDSCTDGCSDSSPEEGCAGGNDTATHDDGCAGGESDSGIDKASGKDSRVGQLLLAKVKDYGTPGWAVDHITWKWFSAPTTEEELQDTMEQFLNDLPGLKLCKKTILGGNLVVH